MYKLTLLFLAIAVAASAGPVQVGTADTGNCYPFTCNDSGSSSGQTQEYQQVYSSTAFGGAITITSIEFPDAYVISQGFGGGPVIGGNYLVELSYSTNPVGGLSGTFANNIGMDLTTVFDGALAGDWTSANGLIIPLSTSFNYNPALGDLLITVIATNQPNIPNGSGNGYLDADDTGDLMSRVYEEGSGSSGSTDDIGLVTIFNPGVAGTPEPSTLAMVGGVFLLAGVIRLRRSKA